MTHDPPGKRKVDEDGLADFAEDTDSPKITEQRSEDVATTRRWAFWLSGTVVLVATMVLVVLLYSRSPIRSRPVSTSGASPAAALVIADARPRASEHIAEPPTPSPVFTPDAPPSRAPRPSPPAVSRPSAVQLPTLEPNEALVPRSEASAVPSTPVLRAPEPEPPAVPPPSRLPRDFGAAGAPSNPGTFAPSHLRTLAPSTLAPSTLAPSTLAPSADSLARDETAIRDLLNDYRDSYNRLDAVSAARLWPGVDTAALSRAFGTLSSQQVQFDSCSIDLEGQGPAEAGHYVRATALCRGSLEYVRRVGNPTPQLRPLTWTFQFDRRSGTWLIAGVTAR